MNSMLGKQQTDKLLQSLLNIFMDEGYSASTTIGDIIVVSIKDAILKKSMVEPWQKELLGEIKDPSYTFFSTVAKQANLNGTLSYMDDIAKIGLIL